MNSVKILHTADLHIGARDAFLGKAAEKRRFEALLTFEKIIDLAQENNVKILAIAGDLFDSNDIQKEFIVGVLNKIAANPEIKVIFAAGNHDPLNSESPFFNNTLPENLYVLPTTDSVITFEDLGVKIYGRSFESSRLTGEELFSIKADESFINIMVQHGDLKSDLGSDYNSITKKFIEASGMDYIALGHIHAHTPIGKIKSTSFAYCGCPEGQGFDELDQKGVYLGEISKNKCDLTFVPVSKRQHIVRQIDISSCDNIPTAIINELKDNYENYTDNLYKIELVGKISPDSVLNITEITTRLSDALYFVKVKDKTEFEIDLELLSKEPTLKGVFVKNMLSLIEQADEKEKLRAALNLGLRAFNGEVKYNED